MPKVIENTLLGKGVANVAVFPATAPTTLPKLRIIPPGKNVVPEAAITGLGPVS